MEVCAFGGCLLCGSALLLERFEFTTEALADDQAGRYQYMSSELIRALNSRQ